MRRSGVSPGSDSSVPCPLPAPGSFGGGPGSEPQPRRCPASSRSLPPLALSCTGTKLNNCNSLFIFHLTVTYCKCSRF